MAEYITIYRCECPDCEAQNHFTADDVGFDPDGQPARCWNCRARFTLGDRGQGYSNPSGGERRRHTGRECVE